MEKTDYLDYLKLQITSYKGKDVKQGTLINVVDDFLLKYQPSKDIRLMDIGCGEGRLIQIMRSRGYENCYGIELNEYKVLIANDRIGEKRVTQGDMHQKFMVDEKFDMVTLHHSLEHSLYPEKALENAHNLLKNDGKVWIIVPYEPMNKEPQGNGNAHTHPYSSERQVRTEVEKFFDIEWLEQENIREREFNVFGTKKNINNAE